MDHGPFDDLARSAVRDGGSRRAVLRLLTGAMLGGFVGRLGLTEVTAAKGKKHRGKKHHKQPKPPPVPDPPCPDGKGLCPDEKTCVYFDECCPGQDQCADGTCVAQDQCCPGQRDCGGGVCVGPNKCCPAEKKCADGECYPKDGGFCCPEEKLCDSETCIPQTECCELTVPLCANCEEAFCNNGTWSCRPGACVCPEGGVPCPLVTQPGYDMPDGCCAASRVFPDEWYGTSNSYCRPEGTWMSFWCTTDGLPGL